MHKEGLLRLSGGSSQVFAALLLAEACGYRLFFLLFGYLAAFFYLLPDVPLKDPYGYAIAHVALPYK